MSAPDNLNPPVVVRYGPTIDALRPCCPPDERRRRAGILYLRDRATAALRVAGWEAAGILAHIEALAAVHALAPMPAEELDTLHRQLVRLMSAAMALDMRGPRAGGMA